MSTALQPWQTRFIELARSCDALKFGEFTLKSGRVSPYFFNAGEFDTGGALSVLGACYADAIAAREIQCDFIFGPAYKGIPLAAVTAAALAERHAMDLPYCFNRKEAKDHGEGGIFVGARPEGRALILDDVMTAGTAVRESMQLLRSVGAEVGAVLIGLDRQEVADGERQSAVMALRESEGVRVEAIVTLSDIRDYLSETGDPELLSQVENYQRQYGVPQS